MNRKIIFIVWIMLGFANLITASQLTAQTNDHGSVTIVVISDLNDAYGETTYSSHLHAAINYVDELRPDLVLCAGDMVAGQNKKLSEENVRAMWQGFDTAVLQRLQAANVPFAFTFGNHDGPNNHSYARDRSVARDFWLLRKPDLDFCDASGFPDYYSFAIKGIFIATIDASTNTVSQQQRDWLKVQLNSDVAQKSRLRLVMGHLPLYAIAAGRNRPGDVLGDADALHSLFCKLGVDYYLSGHHHAFFVSEKDSLKMLSAGALGGGARKLLGCQRPPVKTFTVLNLPASAAQLQIITHDVTNKMRVINIADLPLELPGFNGTSQRQR